MSLYHNGYHGDLNATYPVGKIDEDSERLIRTTRECLDAAIAICKPGALIRDIGKIMCVVIHQYFAFITNEAVVNLSLEKINAQLFAPTRGTA